MKLGQLTIEEFVNKSINLQSYVPYLKADKAKIYRLISCLPQSYKDKIEFNMQNYGQSDKKGKIMFTIQTKIRT